MKIEAKLEKIYYDFAQKGTNFQFFCYGNETANLEKYLGKKVNLELKEWREQRSLDANAYFHVLVQGLANKFGTTLGEMKVIENLKYGTIARNKDGTKVGLKVPYGTEVTSFYPYVKKFGECEENGMTWEKYLVYKETHTLDSKEMATLIEGVVQDCKENGVDTKEDIEFKTLSESW